MSRLHPVKVYNMTQLCIITKTKNHESYKTNKNYLLGFYRAAIRTYVIRIYPRYS